MWKRKPLPIYKWTMKKRTMEEVKQCEERHTLSGSNVMKVVQEKQTSVTKFIVTNPDKGWAWMVMVASFGTHVINGCFLYTVGIIQNALLEKFEKPVAYTSWAGALFVSLMGLVGPLSSVIIQRFSCRIATMIGGLLLSIGCIASAFASNMYQVIIFFGIIGGLGGGLTYSASVIVVGFSFKEKINLACGLAVSGSSVGSFIFPPIISFVKENYGYTGLFIALAGLALHKCLFGVMFRPSVQEIESKMKARKTDVDGSTLLHTYLHVFKTIGIMLIVFSLFFGCIGIYLVYLHLPEYVITKNTSLFDSAFLLSIAGAAGFFSKIFTGFLGHFRRIKVIYIYIGSFSLLGVCTCLFPLYSSTYMGQAMFAVVLGMFSGNCYGILNSINISLAGIDYLAPAYGVEMFSAGVGSLIGPIFAGAVVDSFGTYEPAFILGGCCICFGGILGIFTLCTCGGHECQFRREHNQKYGVEFEDASDELTKMAPDRNMEVDNQA